MRSRLARLAFLAAFLLAAAGCSSKEPTARIGDPAPDFTVSTVLGKTIKLEEFRGKPLVLTFMAEWCPCSNKSAPVFKEAYRTYHPKGVEFVILGFQDSQSKFNEFVTRQAFPYPAAFDKDDKIGISYGVHAPPTTFFILPDGKIQRAYYGKITEIQQLSDWIDEMLLEGPGKK